ncbi:MAG: endonuclease/exonuclease/phosphatase family protein [Flavobacteriales bacterium]|nr:endonuclease/exonuclease/phosphatase family protein [Flavobacteriales bacterium]
MAEQEIPKRRSRTNWLLMLANIGCVALLIGCYLAATFPPSSIGYLALLGLSYPYVLVVNLFFIVYWLFKKRKYALVSLIAILIGLGHLRSFYTMPFGKTKAEDGDTALHVLTYNVRLFNLYEWDNNKKLRNRIFDQLDSINADVICFQEFFRSDRPGYFTTRDTLLKILPTPYYHERYSHAVNGLDYFGVAIFSRYPIINKGFVPFETDVNNYCIYADVVAGNDTLRIFNAHLASIRLQREDYALLDENRANEDVEQGSKRIARRLLKAYKRRQRQVERIDTAITESPYPVVLCGDFNDTPVSYCYNTLTENLDDSFREAGGGVGNTFIGFDNTFLKAWPTFRIDYVLHSPELKCTRYITHPEAFSDHHAVSAFISRED